MKIVKLPSVARTLQKFFHSMAQRCKDTLARVVPKRQPGVAKTETILQMEAVECGAAALGIILQHHKLYRTLEELRIACGVSRDGSKASNMLRAARKYGLIAKGFKYEPESLKQLPMPAILHWNFNHFLVLEGFRKGLVYLNDPADGPRKVTFEELDQSFTGVVLTFEPGPEFKPGGVSQSILPALASRLAGSKKALAYVVLAGLALVIPGLVIPVFSKVFVDEVLLRKMDDWLGPLLLGMGLTAILRAGLTRLQRYFMLRFETRLSLKSSCTFFWHVLGLPVEFYNQRDAGEIGNRVGLNDKVAYLLSGELSTTLINLVMILFYALIMLAYSIPLTVLGISIVSINLLALRYISRKRVDSNRRILKDSGRFMSVAMGGLQTLETIKASGAESDFFSRWSGLMAKKVLAQQEFDIYSRYLMALPPFLGSMNTALILSFGGFLVMDGQLSLGALIAFQSLMASFSAPVDKLVNLGSMLQTTKGDMNRIDDVLKYKNGSSVPFAETADIPDNAHLKLSGLVEISNISFGYSRLEPPLIKDFSLTLYPGSRVALVGPSGSGKSTVAKLVGGLYKPWEGEIRFDGKSYDQIAKSVLSGSLAVVDQDIFLYEGSIRENISLWDDTLPEKNMNDAARDACIHDEIVSRPHGYESELQEWGRNLSGGQRQRMELARALANNPSILVLDEASSALDPITEEQIDAQLRQRGCTCLIVAHRLSTIRDCNEIIYLEHGQILERGTHQELLSRNGKYAQLIGN